MQVPETYTEQVPYQVCTRVPKTISVPVVTNNDCGCGAAAPVMSAPMGGTINGGFGGSVIDGGVIGAPVDGGMIIDGGSAGGTIIDGGAGAVLDGASFGGGFPSPVAAAPVVVSGGVGSYVSVGGGAVGCGRGLGLGSRLGGGCRLFRGCRLGSHRSTYGCN